MILVIAEKPSVGAAIGKVLGATSRKDGYLEGNNYIVSWCVGHLVGLADASSYDERFAKWRYSDLPIVPEEWLFEIPKDKQKQFKVLRDLMRDKRVTELVCATDAGREGELIFRLVYKKAGCTKPFKRLWISSLEDSAIREGFDHLRDSSEYDRLYEAALARSKADWIVGINGTRLFSTLYHKKLVVGRVQTPTLAMLVEREGKISTFHKEKYFNVHISKDNLTAELENVKTEDEAKAIAAACDKKQAVVSSLKKETKTVNPPRLYDLTTLQREANRYYGFTAQQTLDLVQSLYEKKLLTYPRTDSQFITEDMESTARQVIGIVSRKLPLFQRIIGGYSIIYADPPWQYQRSKVQGAAENHYPTMSIDELCALPVAEIAAPDSALFMWATFPQLPEALRLIKAWGFNYKSVAFVWLKKNKKADSWFYGLGFWTRGNAEICLLATRGHPKRQAADVHQFIISPIEAHSKKPDETRDKIISLMGDLPRVELFARQTPPGWDVWGNEVEPTIRDFGTICPKEGV